jgi:hypothetical protein
LTSLLAAVLAALQTFLKFGEIAEKHRAAGARYGAVRRELEHRSALQHAGDKAEWLDQVRTRIDSLAEDSPEVSSRMWRRLTKGAAGRPPLLEQIPPGAEEVTGRATGVEIEDPTAVWAEDVAGPVTGVRFRQPGWSVRGPGEGVDAPDDSARRRPPPSD